LKRFVLWATALGVAMSGLPAHADADKGSAEKKEAADSGESKAPKHRRHRKAHKRGGGGGHHHHITEQQANSPFADVPRDHWAYEAVAKAVESGLLQGYSNKFYGTRAMTRYQMAVVVARMLEKMHVLKQNGRMFTAQDIANLEALTIEFADELALLNVKVSTLEEQTAVLRKDVDVLKYELGVGGPRSPLTGVLSTRTVFTSSNSPGYGQFAAGVAGAPAPFSAATPSTLRYRGDVTGPANFGGAGGTPGTVLAPWQFDSRTFATIAQFSLNLDRQVTRDIEFHMQLDVDAESGDNVNPSSTPNVRFDPATGNAVRFGDNGVPPSATGGPFQLGSGRGTSFNNFPIHVNELYMRANDVIGDADAKWGTYALPFNVENNGPSRTYNWTLTPSVANTFWESLRPVGVELLNGRKEDYWTWNLGIASNMDSPNGGAGGTLLSGIQGVNAIFTTPTDVFGGTSGATGFNLGRMPTPRLSVMTDAPQGVDREFETDNVGWYARVGGQNKDNLGFGWNLGYIDNGGTLRPDFGEFGTNSEWYAYHAEADYKTKSWLALGQYYQGHTKNYSTTELVAGSAAFDSRLVNRGSPFPNLFAEDTISQSIMGLLSYAWNHENSLTLRYENVTDETGVACIGGHWWTLAYNHRMGDYGMLQLEFIDATTYARGDDFTQNDADVNDGLAQINYRLKF
jgi:hypothetical protein